MIAEDPNAQEDVNSSASFARSLASAPLDTANTIHNISVALGSNQVQGKDTDVLMMDPNFGNQQPESHMAVAELLVSLSHSSNVQPESGSDPAPSSITTTQLENTGESSQPSPVYRNAVDYLEAVKRAYITRDQKVYAQFLDSLAQYHSGIIPLGQLVQTVMGLFQDQPELLMGFKDFLPEAQSLMNNLVPPMMYSEYGNRITPAHSDMPPNISISGFKRARELNEFWSGDAATVFLSQVKERSQLEPDMYQHMITLLRKFQKDHSYSSLYFYMSIILRYHPHLLQRFQKFLPAVPNDTEVTEPKVISKAPPEELVISTDFIEAKNFVQTVKLEAKNEMSMYDRFIAALQKYQKTGWTIDQVYSEVSLIFWNNPELLQGFKKFISSVSQNDTSSLNRRYVK